MNWLEWVILGAVALLIVSMLGGIHNRLTYLDGKIDRLVREQFRQRGDDIGIRFQLLELTTKEPYSSFADTRQDAYKELESDYGDFRATYK